jgi:hypothetical protein
LGRTVDEAMEDFARELHDDAVGLWQIDSSGREEFGLEGDQLISFVESGVRVLVERGAKPVLSMQQGSAYWTLQERYGATNDEILDAVITESYRGGRKHVDPTGLWFALPEFYELTLGQE